MASLDLMFEDFAIAHGEPTGDNGYLLATTISPEPPKHDPARLYSFRNGINAYSVRTDLQYKLQYNPALRLDKKWCMSGSSTPNTDTTVTTTSFHPSSTLPVTNMFLLPGGRYLVLVHVDGLRLWDLGFPVSSLFRDKPTSPHSVETWFFDAPTQDAVVKAVLDAASKPAWGGKSNFNLSYCTEPSDGQTSPYVILFFL